jgi:hypothetical protein
MLLLAILDYYRLFYLKLFESIINYFTRLFLAILNNSNIWLVVVSLLRLVVVINSYWYLFYWWLFYSWLLVVILLMVIGGYSINGYWWLFY